MDLFAILNLISLVTGIIQTAKSNDDIATKIEKIAAPLVPALTALAQQLFPGIPNPVAVGATVVDVATVKHIQAALVAKGAKGTNLNVDGLYGPATKAAV